MCVCIWSTWQKVWKTMTVTSNDYSPSYLEGRGWGPRNASCSKQSTKYLEFPCVCCYGAFQESVWFYFILYIRYELASVFTKSVQSGNWKNSLFLSINVDHWFASTNFNARVISRGERLSLSLSSSFHMSIFFLRYFLFSTFRCYKLNTHTHINRPKTREYIIFSHARARGSFTRTPPLPPLTTRRDRLRASPTPLPRPRPVIITRTCVTHTRARAAHFVVAQFTANDEDQFPTPPKTMMMIIIIILLLFEKRQRPNVCLLSLWSIII